jgi:hypothetical protein
MQRQSGIPEVKKYKLEESVSIVFRFLKFSQYQIHKVDIIFRRLRLVHVLSIFHVTDRQHNDQKKKDRRINKDLQNTSQKTKDRVTSLYNCVVCNHRLTMLRYSPIIICNSYENRSLGVVL